MSNNAFWCTMVGSLLAFVLLLVVSIVSIDAYRDCRYIEAGYTRQMLPGHPCPVWTKGSRDDCSVAAPVPMLDPRNWIVSEPVPLSNAAGGGR